MDKSKGTSLYDVICALIIAIVVVFVIGINCVVVAKTYWHKGNGVQTNSKSPRLW